MLKSAMSRMSFFFVFFLFFSFLFPVLSFFSFARNAPQSDWNLIDELNRNFTTPSCGRIISGSPVTFGQKPFQIALFHKEKFICGGSLISQKHVLTAAHCVFRKIPKNMKIHYGTNKYALGIPNQVVRVDIHPNYEAQNNTHDIAMLLLSDPVRYLTNITKKIPNSRNEKSFSFINLIKGKNQTENNTVEVSGWGRVGPFLPTSEQLLVTNLTIIELEECANRWKRIENVTISEGVICAGDTAQKSACRGDSGGPLTSIINGVETLVGVVSIGASNCYSADLPNIFTSVFHYRNWIASLMNR